MKNGWLTKKLVDVATLQRGFDLPTQDRSSGDVPLVTSSGIGDTVSKSAVHGPGVATGRSGSIGNVFYIEEDFWPLNTVLYVKDFHGNDPRFVFHLLKNFDLKRFATGAGVPTLNRNFVHDELVNVPPLAEQQRIVGLLDKAFSGLATAKANAEKNLHNARALFESHIQSVFTQRGPGWLEKRLEDVCVIGDGNHSSNYPKKEELVTKGVPFIRATNLVGGEISDEDMRFLSAEKHAQLKKGHLKTGDILFTNRGEIGKTAIVDADHDGSNLNSQIAWLRCGESLNNRFLFHVLNSGAIKSHLELSKNGAALQQFTIRQIKELKIPIPPKDQQKVLVFSLDALAEEVQRLGQLYERKLTALGALKKSLLHQAFTGAL